jgi:two-component system NtrC family sensor kinase
MEEILIIDDSRQIAELLSQNILPYHGYRTAVAPTGWEGLLMIKQRNPDLVLLDLQLPDTSGLEVLRQMREQGQETPVILMTAHGSEATAVEAFRLGARNYLIKPFSEEDALVAIERALRERRLLREKDALHHNLQQRVLELTILSAIGKSVTSLLHIEEVLERIIEAGVYLTQAEEGFLLLADPQSNELYLRAAKNLGEDRVRHFRVPLEDSLAGQVFRTRQPIRLDKSNTGRALKIKTGFLAHALLQVPLVFGKQAIGVLGVANHKAKRIFSENDQYLLSALADYASIALENARLFQQVSSSEESYRELFDNANDLIFTLDSKLTISTINQLAHQVTGYSVDELVGKPLSVISEVDGWSQTEKRLLELLKGGVERGTFDLTLCCKDGELRFTEVNARIVAGSDPPEQLHCIARDITERRRLEAQLMQAEKLSAIGQLVAGVAHELNNPLTSVTGFTELLLRRDDLDELMTSDLKHIHTQGHRAARIVQNLLTFGRKHHPQRVQVNLNTIIENTLTLHEYHLRVDNIRVIRELDQDLPATVADPDQLQQVFLNLINNASQAMVTQSAGKLTVRSWTGEDGSVRVSVADTGVGMTPQVRSRIFDPFYTTKPVGLGTGLGLSICYGIISGHGGRIWAESEPDQGSTFFVSLPAASRDESPQQQLTSTGKPARKRSLPRLKVLVVDDEEGVSQFLARLLSDLGQDVTTRASGEEALQLLKEQHVDLVLTDIKMPGMSGFELHRSIQIRNPVLGRRVVFITGDTLSPATQALLAQIGNPYIAKPFSIETLESLLADMRPLERPRD